MSGTIAVNAGQNAYFTTTGTYTDALSVGSNSILNVYSTTTASVNLTINDLTGADVGFTLNAGYYATIDLDPATALTAPDTFNIGFENTSDGRTGVTTGYGTLEFGSALNSINTQSSVNFYGQNNTLIVDGTGLSTTFATPINGFANTDAIDLNGLTYATGDYAVWGQSASGGGSLLVFDSDDDLLSTLTFGSGNYKTSKFVVSSDSAGGVQITYLCFLRGTMIATPSGEVPVEALKAGDLVTVLEKGERVARPVTWTGSRSMDVAALGNPDEAFPVRIRRNAFADNVPHRDLLVTPEHCILTDVGLVPARMLVNHASIVIDRGVGEYDFFHIELERHSILLSEGLATESYLDTGHRDLFADPAATVTVREGLAMAAPLVVAREAVEPVWIWLAERACAIGCQSSKIEVALTEEPAIRLLLDNGQELMAYSHKDQRHMFHIPRGTRPMRLLSRAATPATVIGPFVDDRRMLGVAVQKLVVWKGLDDKVLGAAELELPGWHPAEGDVRWTKGDAALDLPVADAETFVDIHVAGTMPFYAADMRIAA